MEILNACADAGYYDSVDLKSCEDNGITTYVPVPKQKVSKKTNVPTPDYHHEKFTYNGDSDTYTCPQGHAMHRCGSRRKKSDDRLIYLYRTKSCQACPMCAVCTTSTQGRSINRWEHEAVLDRLKQRLANQPKITKQRKAIIEHIFGTIKKIWGYGRLLLRRLMNVDSEIALMNTAYNIRRVLNIVGTQKLILHFQQG